MLPLRTMHLLQLEAARSSWDHLPALHMASSNHPDSPRSYMLPRSHFAGGEGKSLAEGAHLSRALSHWSPQTTKPHTSAVPGTP